MSRYYYSLSNQLQQTWTYTMEFIQQTSYAATIAEVSKTPEIKAPDDEKCG